MSTALTTTESLADRINAEHRACEASHAACETLQSECEASAFTGLAHARDAGKLLIKAKRKCKKDKEKWIPWVEANCEFTRRTASWYMRVAENWRRLGENGKRDSHLTSREAKKLLAAPQVKAPKPQTDEGEAAETILRKSGEEELIALVDKGDRQGRQLNALQAVELLDRLEDGSLTPMKFAAHVKQGIPGVREGLKSGPEKPKRSHAEQLAPEWVELRTLVIEARKVLTDWGRQHKSVAHLARTHPNKALAEKALKAVEKLTADVFVIEEELRKYLKS